MKTKSIAYDPASRPAMSSHYTHSACDGSFTSGDNDLPASTVYCKTLEECLQGTNGRKRSNPVIHRKKNLVIQRGSNVFIHSGSNADKWGTTVYANAPALNAETNANAMVDLDSWDVRASTVLFSPERWSFDTSSLVEQKLIEDVYEKARGLKSDVVLNIIEANQIWPSFRSLITSIPQLLRNWNKVRKLVRTASGSYLALKFGVSPFLQDMSDLYRYLPQVKKDLDRHIKGKRDRFSAVFRTPVSFDDHSVVKGYNNGYSYRTLSYQGRIEKSHLVRYVLVTEPRLSFQSDLVNYADRLLSRLGTGPATLAWEKVPYSFVVDWFVDLRGWLRFLDDAIQAPPYRVISFTRSESYVVSTDVFDTRFSPCNGSIIYDAPSGSCRYQHYQRSVVPSGFSPPSLNHRFGKSQAAIMAALIAQKLSGAKRT
jgi:hypothetical protein